ncbi:hypothetical protein Acsp03_37190 [Actinomadura sp. NBRC 104412]|uniref:hypothetical protein n=1 Tax=Actinomadura sp. NBRC 104412 TaxID=3032203 RepID=UPI0024A18B10|nr:hypothetical protein [Actinomadura sp. NBRC 104412]GLZ06253.1 hypothetical protein Acsp03_37190 [Actinomadura sp. NBRC 104412]
MSRRWKAALAAAGSIAAVTAWPVAAGTAASGTSGRADGGERWVLVRHEGFDRSPGVDRAPWRRDPHGPRSPWHVDAFDDDGEAWKAISGPLFARQLGRFGVFRKRVAFGRDGWLTAEVAAVDKDRDGRPDSRPGLSAATLPDGQRVARIHEPSWDAGVLIRPTRPLPPRYRVEMTLRGIDFGGKRGGTFDYDGKHNGYTREPCKTRYPWTFQGALPGKTRCEYPDVTRENGFYYLTILDYATPAPHGNPGIHYRRKVIMDGYYSDDDRWKNAGTCDPRTGRIYRTFEGTFNGVNALFARGDRFRETANNNVSNEYYIKTRCGNVSMDGPYGPGGRFRGHLTSAELRPELLPKAAYRFAVERDRTGYTLEMSGPFLHIGQATLRVHHDFVEDGRPIWHYNQTPGEYDGRFDRRLTHTGPAGTYTTEHTWPKGSAYPDSFIIGDPHLNYYEGSAYVDDIRLYVPENRPRA